MTLKEITLQVVKNLGNFESVRASVTYAIDAEDTMDALARAKADIEAAFDKLYAKRGLPKAEDVILERDILHINSPLLSRVIAMMQEGEITLPEILKTFEVSDDVMEMLQSIK